MEKQSNVTMNSKAEDAIVNFRPIAFFAVCLCVGIAFAVCSALYAFPLWYACFGLPVLGLPFLFCGKGRAYKVFIGVLFLLLAFVLGTLLTSKQLRDFQDVRTYENTPCRVVGRVTEISESEYAYCVVVRNISVDGKQEKGRLIAYLPAVFCQSVRVGDTVVLSGKLTTQAELMGEYGINAYAIGDKINLSMRAENCVVTDSRFAPLARLRERIKQVIYAGMDDTTASVTVALLLGDTTAMEYGLLDNVRKGGIAHVFAVSGLHIGAVFAFLLVCIEKTPIRKLSKPFRFVSVAIPLICYGGICLFTASVIRSLVMCLCGYATALFGIKKDFLETLGFSSIVVLLLSPIALLEAGFALSFGACLGIALLARPLERTMYAFTDKIYALATGKIKTRADILEERNHPLSIPQRIRRTCISYVSMCIGATAATAPVSVFYFGYVSGWTLVCNVLFVPLIVAVFSGLLLCVLICCVLPLSVARLLLYAPNVFWSMLLIVFQTADFSSFIIQTTSVSYPALCCYFSTVAFCSDKLQMQRKYKWLWIAVCTSAFVVSVCAA